MSIDLLADETLDWMSDGDGRIDVFDEVLAFCYASFIDGAAITPRGYDDTETLDSEAIR